MTAEDLVKELTTIFKVHPEAKGAEVWSKVRGEHGSHDSFHMHFVGFDRRHKPPRLYVEEKW